MKKLGHLSNFLFSFLSYANLQICADLSKKPKSIKAIYFYPSERPRHALSENSIFIGVWATVHEILKNKYQKKVLT